MSHLDSQLNKSIRLWCMWKLGDLAIEELLLIAVVQSLIKYCSIAVASRVVESAFGAASEVTDHTAVSAYP